ncbi:MAG: hypothetical protein ACHQ7N_14005 [Candidatus Methylomirabilales bacterium]
MHHAISWLWRHPSQEHLTHPRIAAFFLAAALGGATLAVPVSANAQGWWWRAPSNPGFDQNTVIQVTGRATQVNLVPQGGPSTLRLETGQETFTVMLGPSWYLARVQCDLRVGDPITVEGSKMMDRGGNLHLIAARVTNQRTGSVLELRDDTGRPRWMGGRRFENGR